MVVFGNRKYACLSCIRGHRSSSCDHRDRILLQIRKPGRKSQTEPQRRYALVAKESSPSNCCKESDYKLVKVPDMNSLEDPSENKEMVPDDTQDEDVVVTQKYVFIHVGDNLFRRELRPGYRFTSPPLVTPKIEEYDAVSYNGLEQKLNSTSYFDSSRRPSTTFQSSSSHVTSPREYAPYPQHCHVERNKQTQQDQQQQHHHHQSQQTSQNHLQPHPQQLQQERQQEIVQNNGHHQLSAQGSTDLDPLLTTPQPPLVIGPMQYQHDAQNRQANIMNELGMSAEEATQLWPSPMSAGDFSFATQCVLPGQCRCGDGCECPDCYEHQRQRVPARNIMNKNHSS